MIQRLTLIVLIGVLLFGIPGCGSDYVELKNGVGVSYHKLPTDRYVLFMSRAAAEKAYPAPFKEFETGVNQGRTLRGLFMTRRADGNGFPGDMLFVTTETPKIYTEKYVERLVRMFDILSQDSVNLGKIDMLIDRDDEEWQTAGVFYHELCHMSDSNPRWRGHFRLMLHELWPNVVPMPTEVVKMRNPWRTLKTMWPNWCTHKGYVSDNYDIPQEAAHVR